LFQSALFGKELLLVLPVKEIYSDKGDECQTQNLRLWSIQGVQSIQFLANYREEKEERGYWEIPRKYPPCYAT
jgi:hypothetical protein